MASKPTAPKGSSDHFNLLFAVRPESFSTYKLPLSSKHENSTNPSSSQLHQIDPGAGLQALLIDRDISAEKYDDAARKQDFKFLFAHACTDHQAANVFQATQSNHNAAKDFLLATIND